MSIERVGAGRSRSVGAETAVGSITNSVGDGFKVLHSYAELRFDGQGSAKGASARPSDVTRKTLVVTRLSGSPSTTRLVLANAISKDARD